MTRGQRGVALVLVLWVSALLMVIASSFLFESRGDALVVQNSIAIARAQAAADAGVQRAVFELYRIDNPPDAWKRDGTPHEWTFDDAQVRIEMRDESAKIDVNTASDALLRGLFLSLGMKDDEAAHLVDAILDWRDPDSLTRPFGAEAPEYEAAGLPYHPANAPFQAIEELQLVLGMRPEIYRQISPLVTIFSRQGGVNPQLASRQVLLAIPGISTEAVDNYIAQREAARAAGQPLPNFIQAGPYATSAVQQVATIRSEARLPDKTVFVREAVALIRPAPRRLVSFLAWHESVPEANAPPSTDEAGNALADAGTAPGGSTQ